MPRRPRTPLLASLLAAACIGAGGGAVAYSTLSDRGTVVRQVTVQNAEPAAITSPLSVNSIYRRAYRGVVEIRVVTGIGGAEGSGFVYDSSGHVVTNQHVVEGVESITVKFWNGKTYDANLVGSDSSTDLAVLKVSAPASQLHPLSLGVSGKLVVGDSVVAIGSPFGLEETVTSGIVSALHRSIDSLSKGFRIADSIQTDAAINHGNSGGPLLNARGQVIGVNAQIRSDSGGSDGIGFAIPSDTVRSIAGQLISTGKAQHAYLGVSLDATATSARVAAVRPGTPAAKAHLRAGDVITAVTGTNVDSAEALTRAIDAHSPGDTVTVTYERNGQEHSTQLKLASRPS
ncbi:MAG: trypsin-like peptidase domain-containing protein [Actinomycetota bacterium]|nr:trypsin-like peptidase domain-containing protein [Actinomycetota bacterium]